MRNYGRLAEWSKAAVLKTVDVQASGGSNPSPSANASGCGSRRSKKGSLAQVPLPILFRTLPRPSLRYNIVHRNGDDSLRSSIPSSRRSSLRIPRLPPDNCLLNSKGDFLFNHFDFFIVNCCSITFVLHLLKTSL